MINALEPHQEDVLVGDFARAGKTPGDTGVAGAHFGFNEYQRVGLNVVAHLDGPLERPRVLHLGLLIDAMCNRHGERIIEPIRLVRFNCQFLGSVFLASGSCFKMEFQSPISEASQGSWSFVILPSW